MNLESILQNLLSAPILFFFLGIIAVLLKSDLEIPPTIAKFLSIYLLFDIGIKGGIELYHSGFTTEIGYIMAACVLMALIVPIVSFFILKTKIDNYNAGAIAASYGSVSAVTFATAQAFLLNQNVFANGYMVAGMAIMESPAIVVGIFLIRHYNAKQSIGLEDSSHGSIKTILKEALTNGSIVLLLGSLIIGYLAGDSGEKELHFFVRDIFKGFLAFYLLDLGIIAGSKMGSLTKSGAFLIGFALIIPLVNATLGIMIAYFIKLNSGDALLFTVLCASASYIAVPAAIRMAVPQANMGLLLPMALAVTFPFNIILGIPIYYSVINYIWNNNSHILSFLY
ncbi:MAG: sodium-dependent bicarbonate transport family permease [Cytophagales bacterium]|nr:sodium-dependent bicarbonate transport family permease [Cytophagales bacterium]